jgi:hypothetical protein
MLLLGLDDKLPNFKIDLAHLDATAERVIAITKQAYPSLDIPFHSRWRHFVVGGVDRFASMAKAAAFPDAATRGRAAFDLAMISVFLDAGAGPQWRYTDKASGQSIGRSEGLALASLDMFMRGAFSADASHPLRVDASVLAHLSADQLAQGFQVTPDNPLVGLEGRAALLRRLGALVAESPGVFAQNDSPRPGGLFVDSGVLTLRDDSQLARSHDAGSELVVEWRALTVALLDRLAASIRDRLNMDTITLPLAKVLEGGTWAAGRAIARERRADGTPPITVTSDGTVF